MDVKLAPGTQGRRLLSRVALNFKKGVRVYVVFWAETSTIQLILKLLLCYTDLTLLFNREELSLDREKVMEFRRNLVEAGCQRNRIEVSPDFKFRRLIADRFKTACCDLNKSATTTWIQLLHYVNWPDYKVLLLIAN